MTAALLVFSSCEKNPSKKHPCIEVGTSGLVMSGYSLVDGGITSNVTLNYDETTLRKIAKSETGEEETVNYEGILDGNKLIINGSDGESVTYSNISFNAQGYVTSLDMTDSETQRLVKYEMTYAKNRLTEIKINDGTTSRTLNFLWNDAIIAEIRMAEGTFSFAYNTMADEDEYNFKNKHYRFSGAIAKVIGIDKLEYFILAGHLGNGAAYCPVAMNFSSKNGLNRLYEFTTVVNADGTINKERVNAPTSSFTYNYKYTMK